MHNADAANRKRGGASVVINGRSGGNLLNVAASVGQIDAGAGCGDVHATAGDDVRVRAGNDLSFRQDCNRQLDRGERSDLIIAGDGDKRVWRYPDWLRKSERAIDY